MEGFQHFFPIGHREAKDWSRCSFMGEDGQVVGSDLNDLRR